MTADKGKAAEDAEILIGTHGAAVLLEHAERPPVRIEIHDREVRLLDEDGALAASAPAEDVVLAGLARQATVACVTWDAEGPREHRALVPADHRKVTTSDE